LLPLLLGLAGTMFCAPTHAGDDYTVEFWTVAGGGVMESGSASWTLSGTIGQSEATQAHALSEFPWRLTGGFWAFDLEALVEFWFLDGFESALEATPDLLLSPELPPAP
jgi:hypothetical protein